LNMEGRRSWWGKRVMKSELEFTNVKQKEQNLIPVMVFAL
jgi:hypothetical protein